MKQKLCASVSLRDRRTSALSSVRPERRTGQIGLAAVDERTLACVLRLHKQRALFRSLYLSLSLYHSITHKLLLLPLLSQLAETKQNKTNQIFQLALANGDLPVNKSQSSSPLFNTFSLQVGAKFCSSITRYSAAFSSITSLLQRLTTIKPER